VELLEVGHAVLPADNRLAVDQEAADPELPGGVDDTGIAMGPVEAAACK
jgi:hypothetical protein